MIKLTSLVRNNNYRGQKKRKFNRKIINKNEDPGEIGNLFCRLLTKMDETCMLHLDIFAYSAGRCKLKFSNLKI